MVVQTSRDLEAQLEELYDLIKVDLPTPRTWQGRNTTQTRAALRMAIQDSRRLKQSPATLEFAQLGMKLLRQRLTERGRGIRKPA